jgi:hypothetical protein
MILAELAEFFEHKTEKSEDLGLNRRIILKCISNRPRICGLDSSGWGEWRGFIQQMGD